MLRLGTPARPVRAGPSALGTPRASITGESWAGVRAALASPAIHPLLLLSWLPPMFAVVPEALAAPYAREIGAPEYGVGVLLGAAALGSVLGAVTIGSWTSAHAREQLIVPLALLNVAPLLGFLPARRCSLPPVCWCAWASG